jgi:hypothetical protein
MLEGLGIQGMFASVPKERNGVPHQEFLIQMDIAK